jgi:hypothetical protein
MKFGVEYERKCNSGCTFNTVLDFSVSRANELADYYISNELDDFVYNYFNDNDAFSGVLFYCYYLDVCPIYKTKVGRIIQSNNGKKGVKTEAYIDYKLVKAADELDSDTFVAFHEIIRLDAIIAASKKYKIPEENYKELVERRSKLGTIPEWIPEMEKNPQLVIDMYKASVPR